MLKEDHPKVLEKATKMLWKLSKKKYPEIVKYEKSYPFVDCANTADHLKNHDKYSFQAPWHSIHTPYIVDSDKTENDFYVRKRPTNLVTALQTLTDFLSNTKDRSY